MNPKSNFIRASNHYRSLDIGARVEAASPHGLVALLYEELLYSVDIVSASMRRGLDLTHEKNVHRARAILIALIASLDHEKGGTLSVSLEKVYRSMIGQLSRVVTNGDAEQLVELRNGIVSVADAWNKLI